MRRFFFFLLLLFFLVAYVTKPDDKTCIIEGVRAVWGTRVPKAGTQLFEQFMDLTNSDVRVKDWVLFKQVKYQMPSGEKTVAYGAFKNVFATVGPMKEKHFIPKMPSAR